MEEIVADILSVVSKTPKKTHIMYGANLSYTLLCKYLDRLVEVGLVKFRKKNRVYELTDRGQAFLERYEEYEHLRDRLENNRSTLTEKASLLSGLIQVKDSEME